MTKDARALVDAAEATGPKFAVLADSYGQVMIPALLAYLFLSSERTRFEVHPRTMATALDGRALKIDGQEDGSIVVTVIPFADAIEHARRSGGSETHIITADKEKGGA